MNNNQVNVINLALIYNYLANKNNKISINIINKYIEIINKYLERENKNKISIKINKKNNCNYNYINLDAEEFIELNIKNIDLEDLYYETIHYLDDYLINITLYQGVLDVLGIKRDNLPIENYYERKQDNIDIHTTTNKSVANEAAKNIL